MPCELMAMWAVSMTATRFTHTIIQFTMNSSITRATRLKQKFHKCICNFYVQFKLCVQFLLCVFTSQDNPPYPGGQAHISTADALFPPAKGFATCIENEWSLHKIKNDETTTNNLLAHCKFIYPAIK